MSEVRNKRIARIMSVFLFVAFILSASLTTNEVQAAAKPSIAATLKIGTGSIVGSFDYYSPSQKYVLTVANAGKNATYSFVSSDTKTLTVAASGTSANLTGLKAGTATITCNQKLSGKTTKVGTCKVTVVSSSLYQDFTPNISLGTGTLEVIEFAYRNNNATYTYVSDNKNFSITESISKFDGMNFIKQKYTALAAGTYTVTVKETYNKVTRVVGKLKFTAQKAAVTPEETIDLGLDSDAFGLINYCRTDVSYAFETGDSSIVEIAKSGSGVSLLGKKVGTTNINIYENTKTADKSKLLGTCTITVKEVVLESLDCEFDDTEANVGGDPVSVAVYKVPEHAPGAITVTSSDPKVATVSSVDEDGNFEVTPVSAGTTTITITCGTITKTQTFTVNED